MTDRPVRVCFVCSGNICRSPTAEVVLRSLASPGEVMVDSAGTGGWHVGDEMDARSRATLDAAGYAPGPHSAQQFDAGMFADRDVVVALDAGHFDALRQLAERSDDPAAARARLVLLRDFDPQAREGDRDVADPYYGGADGFTTVLHQIERGCAGLLDAVRAGRF